MLLALSLAEPTGAPMNVKILWIKGTSAELSWKAIPRPEQNGIILRYLVRHDYELPNGTFAVQQSETIWNALDITLWNLSPNRNYAVRVAGVNDAGVGAFSLPIQLITPGGIYISKHYADIFKNMINQCCFSCHSVCPGSVRITAAETTCHSITIHWISPLDENRAPYEVRIKFPISSNDNQ